jgi:6-phosphofructokinase 1
MGNIKKLGILVGGGPAPGINSVIAAATIRGALQGVEVVGIRDGFEHIMRGDADSIRELTIDDVSRIHFRGGSVLGTSRANPTKDPAGMKRAIETLQRFGVNRLVTIGGDDTAFSALKTSQAGGDALQVVHVPKTIDNDLDLPPDIDTFGYQTARHVGAEVVKNLMTDAFTTSRWYFVVAMGRKAGHLALGMGKAAGATLTLISEEFGKEPVPLQTVVDTLIGAIIKRTSQGRKNGVAVMAEGLALSIRHEDLGDLDGVERDEHGHIRIAEVDIGDMLKRAVSAGLSELGMKTTVVSKNVGYELRCADPIPLDAEHTRDLGYSAAKYVLNGGTEAMVSIQGGRFVPIPLAGMLDPQTGRTRVRLVDTNSARYKIAHRYMIRIRRDDFDSEESVARLASQTNLTPSQFRERFEPVAEFEPSSLDLD